MIFVCIAIFFAGVYLGWRGGSMAAEERFAQEEQNRLTLESAKSKQEAYIKKQIREEETERRKVVKVIEKEERVRMQTVQPDEQKDIVTW